MKNLKFVLILVFVSLGVTQTFAQKNIEIPEGKAVVYIFRTSVMGSMVKMKINCDGEYVGATKGKKYIYTFVDPGEHTFTCKTEATDEITAEFEAGKTYYIKQSVTPGAIMARSKFKFIDEAEAKKAFKKCKLSKYQVEGKKK